MNIRKSQYKLIVKKNVSKSPDYFSYGRTNTFLSKNVKKVKMDQVKIC